MRGNDLRNKSFKPLTENKEGDDWMSSGREFQRTDAATKKRAATNGGITE